MTSKQTLRGSLLGVLAASTLLAGCASVPGPYNGLGTDPMTMVILHKNPDYGDVTAADYTLATVHANSCYVDGKRQLAGTFETSGSMAAANGLTGLGSGSIITQFVPGATVGVYAPYVGTLNAVGGGTAGLQVQSSAMNSFVGACTNGDLNDPVTREKAPGLHVYPALVRSNNRSGKTPAWVKKDSAAPAAPASGN